MSKERTITPDPRLHAYREDIAAIALRGRVAAPSYIEGEKMQVVAASTGVRRTPADDAMLDTELLFGETVMTYDTRDGWAWVQADSDDYVGYVRTADLSTEVHSPTHRITALRTYLYGVPDIKSPPAGLLSLNAKLCIRDTHEKFLVLEDGRFVFARHVEPLDVVARDFVAVAAHFIGAPYLWGGRTSIGLDCSSLVQLSLAAAGIRSPRDTYMQEAELGVLVDTHGMEDLQRGDLVFWQGHVGIVTDDEHILHANGHHMAVVVEKLWKTTFRIGRQNIDVSSIKRLPALTGGEKFYDD